MKGPLTGPHSADFLRGVLLWMHGGVSMDVGIILIRDLDRLCWNKMTEPDSPYRVATQHTWGQTISNFFVAARKDDPFTK
jgi:mannosyltransferase OCH1-like enzyme